MPIVKKQKKKTTRQSKETTDNIEDLIQSVDFTGQGIKISIYGRSGTGKTTIWSTFPAPILAIIASGGQKSGELRSVPLHLRKNIRQAAITNSEQFAKLLEYQEETQKFKTVVLDNASGLADFNLAEILGLEVIPAQKSWGLATREEYGQNVLQMKTMLRQLLNLDCNVVIISQEREFTPEGEDSLLMPYVGPALSPKVTGWLNPACDYIVQTFIRQKTKTVKQKIGKKVVTKTVRVSGVQYCIRTGPHEVFTTKFRNPGGSDKLPEEIVNPTYSKIMELIEE